MDGQHGQYGVLGLCHLSVAHVQPNQRGRLPLLHISHRLEPRRHRVLRANGAAFSTAHPPALATAHEPTNWSTHKAAQQPAQWPAHAAAHGAAFDAAQFAASRTPEWTAQKPAQRSAQRPAQRQAHAETERTAVVPALEAPIISAERQA